jgi:hypothetical protein
MGLLDDAIRDHLELKRRHGADPGEVARLENEALGPVRRESRTAAPVTEEPPAAEDRTVYDLDDDDDEVPAEERLDAHLRPGSREPHPPDEPDQPTRQYSIEELEAASEEEPPAPTREDDVDPADEEPKRDDVLEETPEFLQETPEHDRLWFEQKPPRDFEF